VQVWFIAFLLDGARFNEVFNLTQDCIVNNRVEFEVSKKGHQRVLKSIPLTDKLNFLFTLTQQQGYPGNRLVGFFDKPAYKKQNARSYLSSWNAMLNKELKVYARKAQVNRKISMHVARNTFAYMADKMGYSLVEIQDALKHSNVQVTRNYIGRLQNDRLDGKRKEMHKLF